MPARGPGATSAIVWPSAAAFSVALTPMVPPAPARFSTTTGSPSACPMRSASMRASEWVGPPAEEATISLIGRLRQSCASAPVGASAPPTAPIVAMKAVTRRRFLRFDSIGVSMLVFRISSGALSFRRHGGDDRWPLLHPPEPGRKPRCLASPAKGIEPVVQVAERADKREVADGEGRLLQLRDLAFEALQHRARLSVERVDELLQRCFAFKIGSASC